MRQFDDVTDGAGQAVSAPPPGSRSGDDAVVAVIGEALVDLMPDGGGDRLLVVPGGSPANVAVGLARLDVPVRFIARIGGDSLAQHIRRHLVENRVDLAHSVSSSARSSVAIVGLDREGNAEYDFRVEGAADWGWTDDELLTVLDDDVVALHAGSLAMTMTPGRDAIRRLIERAHPRVTVSYDPNCRPQLMGSANDVRNQLSATLPSIDILRASADDIAWLAPRREPLDVAEEWLREGPALVVVTLGEHGAFAVGPLAGHVVQPGRAVEVVDTVGAGDSFTSALLAALHRRSFLGAAGRDALRRAESHEIGAILDEAVFASSITCTRKGAQPPMLDDLTAMSA